MTRKGLVASMVMAGALLVGPQAHAAQNYGAVSNVINQLYYGSNLTGNGFSFSIVQNGQAQTLFTGLSGLHQFNDLGGFSNWANPSVPEPGGYDYTPTFNGVGGFFGAGSGTPQQTYAYTPTFTAAANYFNNGGSGDGDTGGSYDYTPTFTGTANYFSARSAGQPVPNAPLPSPPVPEPGTWAMMILGFFAVGSTMRRRKGKTNFA